MNSNDKIEDEKVEINPELLEVAELNQMMNFFNIMDLIRPFEMCPICSENQELYVIEGCLHATCRNCLKEHIKNQSYPPRCPGIIIGVAPHPIPCHIVIQDEVCYEILDNEDHALFRQKRMANRYIYEDNLFPCYSPDCPGSNKSDRNSQAKCLRCGTISCYACRAVHKPGETCEMWETENDDVVRNRHFQKLANERKIQNNEGMYCPKCSVFIEYMGGCDGIVCQVCHHDICYRTKQSRWGPKGFGDTTGGCRCMVNGVKCHEDCQNCH